MEASDRDIIAGNAAYYWAFSTRDPDAMARLWSSSAQVTCIHPGWDMLVGYDAVMKSWRDILGNSQSPSIECRNARDFVAGDFGYVLCHEVLDEGVLIATNIFRREDGAWRMVHHQAGPAASALPGPPAPVSGSVH
ncbi:MAG: nuclear transport factor 2 family protein [Alphaproteobacteria bacterium]